MENDYNVLLVVAQTPGFMAPQVRTLLHSGAQDLPAGLEEKLPSLAPVYPLYYGWFWPPRCNCNDKCCSESDLWTVEPSKETADLSAVNPLFGKLPPANEGYPAPTRPHVTSYYSNYGAQPGAKEYADLLIVNEALLGRVDTLSVLGLMVSKRTIGARLELESAMLPFWRQDDSARVEGSLGGDWPSRPVGSRAHATLALAKGVEAVETGFDTMRVFDAEARGYPDTKRTEVADGIIYDITMPSKGTGEPEHMFYYEFKTPLTPRVMYTSFY
ncbi:unnamed protein product [Dibothriocephalus latus]|uniref:Cyclic nucleotide phosphodiesterase catalytic domain-containing protein n=1 Tax=Dibothriocephalus latus TaxID=60516 RepID=A0A3P7NUJ7_DIBLA|nr:unnamed protein product [Dibothriocephalus latus]